MTHGRNAEGSESQVAPGLLPDEERSGPSASPNSDYEVTKKLHSTTDARVWAEEWCRIAREIEASNDGREIIDEGWMIGWFANAIMRGWDEHARRYPPPPEPDDEEIGYYGAR